MCRSETCTETTLTTDSYDSCPIPKHSEEEKEMGYVCRKYCGEVQDLGSNPSRSTTYMVAVDAENSIKTR